MIDRNVPVELSADQLLDDVRHLSVVIGPRRPATAGERAAAAYVHSQIRALNPQWELINQPFRTIPGFRWRIAPISAAVGLALLGGLKRGRQGRWVTGLVSVALSILSRDTFLARAQPGEGILARGESENVIVRIPPRRRVRRRVVFVAHLDSGVHRMTTGSRLVGQLPRTLGAVTLLALVGGVLTALAGGQQRWRSLRAAIGGLALGGAALAVLDESGPSVAGANGNASGVAALLALARALRHDPLENTEVVLAFTGSATAVSAGADTLAVEYEESWRDALWMVVSNVGAGELCWVTRHGISPYAYYHPHPDAVSVMERVADARPDLGLMGKPMLTLDEVSNLRDRDLMAVGLMAYDRVTGHIPNWRRRTDTIHEIDPQTIERAAHSLWTAAQVVDQADVWPPRA
ncbi:MAG: M28 family peptidase [Chloroflexi bacterium]|nr:M28 family peptidase [Chloroflexota bacterium]